MKNKIEKKTVHLLFESSGYYTTRHCSTQLPVHCFPLLLFVLGCYRNHEISRSGFCNPVVILVNSRVHSVLFV